MKIRFASTRKGHCSLDIWRITLFLYYPNVNLIRDSMRVGIFLKTCLVVQLKPNWVCNWCAAIQVLGFGFGFGADHTDNPFRKAYLIDGRTY